MKKFFSFVAAVLFASSMMAEVGLVYTLKYANAEGAGNGYAATYDVTVDGIDWNVPGNATMNPARIGGKNLADVDRVIYSKTPIVNNISKIEIEHGTATDITVNSMTVMVASDEAFANVISTLNPDFVANGVVAVDCPEGADWSNAYYKIIYNVTVTANANKYIQFIEARFLGEGGAPIQIPDTIPATVAEAVAAGMALDSLATSFDVYEVTGFVVKSQPYNTDYKNQIWFMVDDTTAAEPETEFQAYGCLAKEDNVALQVIDGDKVVLKGKLTKYWNATESKFVIEIANGAAEFIEKAEGDHSIEPEPEPLPEGVISCAQAVAAAANLADPTADNKTIKGEAVVVRGYVTFAYDAADGKQSVWVDDKKGGNGLLQGAYLQVTESVAVGDYVELNGTLAKYYRASKNDVVIEVVDGTMSKVGGQGIENVTLTEKAQKVMIDGVMYIVRDGKMFNVQGAQVR